ncbi:RsbR, positive regulator of sigma-B [Enhygromyxa salina]|uniref:RsbR, positive regulator of sigma-B n=1 Tax=Enhygromyxa salina TaxID=215803 RepID=A0A0C2CYM9_9BACT|nr:STAS domain-containing protein [Enhygromyxa salina]KIG14720.1 RsbR, positive regulator of sigma-B [Enhygromyxa salina]
MSLFDASTRTELVSSVTQRLAKRRMSAFSVAGEEPCRVHVEAAVDALERDTEAGTAEAMRVVAVAFTNTFLAHGLGYSDLTFFTRLLRERARELAPAHQRAAIEQWCYDHLVVSTTHFMVQRDDALQREAAQRDIERFESQLAELRVALNEKTQLLELIREASTPIAPVVPGILVVPLVGTFDRFRAELLTERLLDAIGQSRARVTILDISGVPVFDTDAAQLVIRLARSVRLLGAKVILVGMSPDNARTIVELGVALDGMMTCRALQDGLRAALAIQRLKLVSTEF